jgi:hypothetical protein
VVSAWTVALARGKRPLPTEPRSALGVQRRSGGRLRQVASSTNTCRRRDRPSRCRPDESAPASRACGRRR